MVTGASSGIGSALARGLAAAGADLVLVARRADRLAALADELRAAHRTEVTVLPRDLAAPDAGPALRAELSSRGLRVTGLVNNAGFGGGLPFGREDPARLEAMPAEEERGRERVLCVSPSSTGTEFFDVAGTPGAGGGGPARPRRHRGRPPAAADGPPGHGGGAPPGSGPAVRLSPSGAGGGTA
nr:SDR family NAD(P)-dependent oxidoreductase [Micrococcus sp. ACRRV]